MGQRAFAAGLALAFVPALVGSCGDSPPPPSGVDLTAIDSTVDPCQDFYRYACGAWIRKHPVAADGNNASRFNDPFYQLVPTLRDIMTSDAAGMANADDPDGLTVGGYYQTCLEAPSQSTATAELAPMLTAIQNIQSLDDLARQVAAQRKIGSGTLFSNGVIKNVADPDHRVMYLDQGGVELERYHYVDASEQPTLDAYRKHINRLASFFPSVTIDADQVLQIESALAHAGLDPEDRTDPRMLHHLMSVSDAATLAPSFPWAAYWNAMGLDGIETVDVALPDYLKTVDSLLQTTPLATLKMYMAWQLIEDKASRMDQRIVDEEFAFWDVIINGLAAPSPRWWTCYVDTQRRFGMSLSRPYIARFYPSQTTADVQDMVTQIRAAFSKRIGASSWLDAATQAEAQAKLGLIVDKIGYPNHWPTLDLLGFGGKFIELDLKFDAWAIDHSLRDLSLPVDHDEWSTTPITVNAFYSQGDNAITLPAAILNLPFFHDGHSAASNYGAIGAVIGHELTHGFDNAGRLFDGAGALRDWWNPDTEAAFEARAQCVVDQYSSYSPLPGLMVDGKQTLTENLADIGGLNIAYDAWMASGHHEGDRGGFDDRQQFFLSFAQVWCQSVRPEFLTSQVNTDVHAPARERVNGTLANVPAAAAAFSCGPGTPLAPTAPCVVW